MRSTLFGKEEHKGKNSVCLFASILLDSPFFHLPKRSFVCRPFQGLSLIFDHHFMWFRFFGQKDMILSLPNFCRVEMASVHASLPTSPSPCPSSPERDSSELSECSYSHSPTWSPFVEPLSVSGLFVSHQPPALVLGQQHMPFPTQQIPFLH